MELNESDSSEGQELVIDIDNGGTDDIGIDPVSVNKKPNKILARYPSGALSYNGPEKGEPNGIANGYSLEVLIDKNLGTLQNEEHLPLVDKENQKEKQKPIKPKKSPKPPRPPQGPILDASDMKLVKEISEITMKKRERKERIKALKKMKGTKPSSQLAYSVSAMVITAIFCFVLIVQGLSSGDAGVVTLQESPDPASGQNGWISVQLYSHLPKRKAEWSSESPWSEEDPRSGFRSPG